MINPKLIIFGVFVVIVIAVAAYIGIQSKRIDLLKSENIALRVSLESAEDVIVKQNESITALMLQLSQSDSACRKQLEARKTVKAIFKPPKKQSEAAHPLLRASAEPAQEQIKTLDVIDHEKNTVAVAYLNELFLVRTADGL